MRKIYMFLILVAVVLISASSCAPTVSKEEYDRISSELSTMQNQLAELQGKLAETVVLKAQNEDLQKQFNNLKGEYDALKSEYEDLGTENKDLQKQFDDARSDYNSLESEYGALMTEYQELNKEYEAIINEKAEVIGVEEVEQAIFGLINQDRKSQGIEELLWGKNIYKWAKQNSRNMATNQRLEYSQYGGYQAAYRATGYTTATGMAEAVVTVWKNTERYELNFLNSVMVYGAVAVYQSGEIYNITFVADYFQ
jgi:chromosome segregation ATPase